MRNVIFVAPFPMPATLRFARALRTLMDVRLLGIWQQPPPDDGTFDVIKVVPDAMDTDVLSAATLELSQRFGRVHRIVGILENLQEQLAVVRSRMGIPGPDLATCERFRDKGLMKDALRAAGIPCARHARLREDQDAWRFVEEVGFPIVVKPPAGAGARATWRIRDAEALREALGHLRLSRHNEVLAEEFLRGQEHSFETVTLNNRPLFHSISRYLPTPLEVLENPWMQWCCVLPRDISGAEYDPARALGAKVIEALRPGNAVTHMEWFRRHDGTLAVGEIAMRPPGAQITLMTGLVHDVDFHRVWARAVVDEAFDGPWERRYSAGVAFLRGQGRGQVSAVRGVEEAQRRMGGLVVDARLPQIGAPKTDTYEGDGYAVLRHPDTAAVMEGLKILVETVRVEYTG